MVWLSSKVEKYLQIILQNAIRKRKKKAEEIDEDKRGSLLLHLFDECSKSLTKITFSTHKRISSKHQAISTRKLEYTIPDILTPTVRYPAIGHLNELKQKDSYDPLSRTGRFFGGLIRDVKALRKRYLSLVSSLFIDFTGFFQCLG